MLPQWIIEKKRDGGELSREEIAFIVKHFTEGNLPDSQMSAFAMAVYFKGMTPGETACLTEEMMLSGDVIDPASLPGIKADKHSTGGIGDKTSLIIAPLAAACGLTVPMISGRGLGITGGTLDKLDAIPGFHTDLSGQEFFQCLEKTGCAIIGQTAQLVPADKKLYALRDVTGTVPSIPLITASIMSKKLAEGIDTLVLDVKWGRGAFMKTVEQARRLANSMVEVGTHMGKNVRALITDMNAPLGRAAGNALEVQECLEVLRGGGPDDLKELSVELTAHMLELAGIFPTLGKARKECFQCLENGAALKKFEEMVTAQGGSTDWKFAKAQFRETLFAPADGVIEAVDAELIGKGCLMLGAGRRNAGDAIDYAAGVAQMKKPGEKVKKGEPLAVIFSNDRKKLEESFPMFGKAFTIGANKRPVPLICEVIERKPVMKQSMSRLPKYFETLIGAVLVVTVIQYMLITGLIHPVHLISNFLQLFCYMLLAVAIFRGFIQRSRLAWLAAQIMLVALFAFSLLFTAVSAVLSIKTQSLWTMLGVAVLVAVVNGILLGILFSLPVCDYFQPVPVRARNDDPQ